MRILEEGKLPATPEEAVEYLPDNPTVRGLFRCWVGMGEPLLVAFDKALKASLPSDVFPPVMEQVLLDGDSLDVLGDLPKFFKVGWRVVPGTIVPSAYERESKSIGKFVQTRLTLVLEKPKEGSSAPR